MARLGGNTIREIRQHMLGLMAEKDQIIPGMEDLSREAEASFLRTLAQLEAAIHRSDENKQNELVVQLAGDLFYLVGFQSGSSTSARVALEMAVNNIIAPPAPHELNEVGGVMSKGVEDTEQDVNNETTSPQVAFFARFLTDFRRTKKMPLLDSYFPQVDFVDEQYTRVVKERLERLTPAEKREAQRQLYLAFNYLFDNLESNNVNTGSGGGPVFGNVKYPIQGPFSKDNFFAVTGDPEHSADHSLKGVTDRFPEPFQSFLSDHVTNYITAKINATVEAAKVYQKYSGGRFTVSDYATFVSGVYPLNDYMVKNAVGNESAALEFAANNESGLAISQDMVHDQLIRYAEDLISIFHLGGKVDGKTENVAEVIQEKVVEKCARAYQRVLGGRELNKLEKEFVQSCVRYAYTFRRLAGFEFLADSACISSEVNQMVCAREYHLKKNVEADPESAMAGGSATGANFFSPETARVLHRAAVPWEYHISMTLRLPQEAIEVVGPEVFFEQLKKKYDNPTKSLEYDSVASMLTPDMRVALPNNRARLNYQEIGRYFVAVRIKDKRLRLLGLPDNEANYVLMPKSAIIGHPNTDGISGKYVSVTASLEQINGLRVKYFDDNEDGESQRLYAGLSPADEAKMRHIILPSSLFDKPGSNYQQTLANQAKIYDIGRTDEIKHFDLRAIQLLIARYPEGSTVHFLFGHQPLQQIKEAAYRRIPFLPKVVSTPKMAFSYERHAKSLIESMEESFSIESDLDKAIRDQDSSLSALFYRGIHYVVMGSIGNNPREVIDPRDGKAWPQNPEKMAFSIVSALDKEGKSVGQIGNRRIIARSLLPIRMMFGDRLELDEQNKLMSKTKGLPRTDAEFSPKKMFEFINAWENVHDAVGLPPNLRTNDLKKNDEINIMGIELEMLFEMLDLYLSKYKPIPLPDGANLAYFRSYIVETIGGKKYTPLTPLDVFKLRQIIPRFIYYVVLSTMPHDDKYFERVNAFLDSNHYREDDIKNRLDLMLESYGITKSFEAAVVARKFEAGEYEKLPTAKDIEAKPEEAKKS